MMILKRRLPVWNLVNTTNALLVPEGDQSVQILFCLNVDVTLL